MYSDFSRKSVLFHFCAKTFAKGFRHYTKERPAFRACSKSFCKMF